MGEHWHGDEGSGSLAARLNWLRAGVLGANDGIVSTAGLVVGVAGATAERTPVLVAGVAAVDPEELTNPWHAAAASIAAFAVGALLPLLAIVVPPVS